MRLFSKANYDFMRYRRIFIIGSLVANVIGLAVFFTVGVNLGIDFTGGTEMQLRFAQAPDLAAVRHSLSSAGLKNPTVTTIGDPKENELYIRVAEDPGAKGQDITRRVVTAVVGGQEGGIDLNLADERTLRIALEKAPGMTAEQASALSAAVAARRRERSGMLASMEDLRSVVGMTDAAFDYLKSTARVGPVAIRAQNYVGPSVAPELRRKAFGAVIASMFAMLLYIGFRFRIQWGLGAIIALIHDVIITLGIFCLSRKEFSLPVVASFLTLVGYSVNDTIVVFDRIRENLRLKGAGDLVKTINSSINQTLSRTIITSFLTWIVCVALWRFGGDALNGFAFVLVVGIIIGTYSSIYIASPVIIFWEWLFTSRKNKKMVEGRASAPRMQAKKSPTGQKAAR